jgi:hypothetical protein
VETITPQKALEMLNASSSFKNRAVRMSVRKTYARDMRDGRWRLVYDPIRIDTHGRVIDGQHRLLAVIDSGVTIEFFVVRGVPPEDAYVIDAGTPRRARDLLHMAGEANSTLLASVLNTIFKYEVGMLTDVASNGLPRAMVNRFLADHPAAPKSLEVASTLRLVTRRVGLMGAAHYIMSQKDEERADWFFARLRDGLNLTETTPVYLFRQRLLSATPAKREIETSLLACAIKAWNFTRRGESARLLSWKIGVESFPEAI